MDYPQRVKQEQSTDRTERPRQSLEAWVIDLCTCRECRDGFVSMEVKGYETLFACPVCDRYKRDLIGYGGAVLTSIPIAKKWEGKVDMYTSKEMEEIISRRREVARTLRNRAARRVNWTDAVEKIGSMEGGPF